jgi:hypothetical protein
MHIKKAVVQENVSPCVETGKPCETIHDGEPCLRKYAATKLSVTSGTKTEDTKRNGAQL